MVCLCQDYQYACFEINLLNRQDGSTASSVSVTTAASEVTTLWHGTNVYVSLPDDVTSAPSLSTFRRHLRRTYSAAVSTLFDSAHLLYYSDCSGPRGGVAA